MEDPSLDFSPDISMGVAHVHVPFCSDMVCPGLSPASAVPTTSALGHCCLPLTFVCAPAVDTSKNATPAMLIVRAFIVPPREFECIEIYPGSANEPLARASYACAIPEDSEISAPRSRLAFPGRGTLNISRGF
jgi:hypothetical protein